MLNSSVLLIHNHIKLWATDNGRIQGWITLPHFFNSFIYSSSVTSIPALAGYLYWYTAVDNSMGKVCPPPPQARN